MANTKWPHTETSKRQYIDKKNHSIMLFFQRQNKTKVAFSGFSLKLLPPVKTYSSLFSCQLSKPHHCEQPKAVLWTWLCIIITAPHENISRNAFKLRQNKDELLKTKFFPQTAQYGHHAWKMSVQAVEV